MYNVPIFALTKHLIRQGKVHYFTDNVLQNFGSNLRNYSALCLFPFSKTPGNRLGVNYPTRFFKMQCIEWMWWKCYQLETEGGVTIWNGIVSIRQQLILCCSWSFIVMWSTATFLVTHNVVNNLSIFVDSINAGCSRSYFWWTPILRKPFAGWFVGAHCTTDLTVDQIFQHPQN